MAVKQAAEWSDKVEQILKLFPVHIRKVMEQAEVFQRLSQKLEEIRVRVNQPLELVTADGAYFLNNGALVSSLFHCHSLIYAIAILLELLSARTKQKTPGKVSRSLRFPAMIFFPEFVNRA